VIVGYGDDDQHVQAELKKLGGNITFTGKVPFQEMISYYNRSRVYASTSYYEGLPGTCLEAMAMGLPPVVWNFDFYRGLVEDGKSGRTIGINDYDRMAEAILDILGSPEKEKSFGEVSTQILRGKYDWKNLAQSIVSELTELANEKTAA
jgi:glycosyltransferase involved in cell wall biosynthesis